MLHVMPPSCSMLLVRFHQNRFSPLGVIPRTDLYVYTGIAPAALTRAQLISLLGDDEVDRLVIHSEKALAQDRFD